MRGEIYTDEKCSICGSALRHNHKDGLECPKHPRCKATTFRVLYGTIHKRFRSYDRAYRFLIGLRHEADEKKLDPRDYRSSNPLGFSTLAEKFLRKKAHLSSYRQIRYHMDKATGFFGPRNVKTIQYGELEDFIDALEGLSEKSKHNILGTVHSFWTWLNKRERLSIPDFPQVKYDLSWRKLVDKETQLRIIDEVERIAGNRKTWIAIKWLATYIAIRPKEMLAIKEGDFNFDIGGVFIRRPKEGEPKFVPFLQEDMRLVKSFPPAFPEMYFFRHHVGYGGVTPGSKMERDCLWRTWKKACKNLGIEGVDLYGGTKHSSATALRKYYSPEQIRRATMHQTNKAFDRYFRIETEDVREIFGKTLARDLSPPGKGEVVDIKSRK